MCKLSLIIIKLSIIYKLEFKEEINMPQVGYKIIGTIKEVQGFCNKGHKVGDKLDLDCHDSGGLCGFFYHDIFPNLMMLQFGGNYPKSWVENPDVLELECPDRTNAVKIELKRIKQ
jgi:uncharacterized repeat protein (TIGR04076 family)